MHWILLAALLAAMPFDRVAIAGEPPQSLRRKEKAARSRVADEILKLAVFCRKGKAWSRVKAEVEKGLKLSPGHRKLKTEARKLPDRADEAEQAFWSDYEKEREKVYLKCVGRLATVALLYEKKGFPDHFHRLATLARTNLPCDGGTDLFGLTWFEPYRTWVQKDDAEKLAQGWEKVDGEWVSPADVVEQNAKHSTFKDPWVISDGVHELRTNLPLRDARRVLGHTTSFRRFLLAQYQGEWDLRPARGLLPVIVTTTQAEFLNQARKVGGGMVPPGRLGAALYLQGGGALNPCLATLEQNTANAGTIKVSLEEMFFALRHELTHQITAEYVMYDRDHPKRTMHQFWCIEGIASLASFYVLDRQGWHLSRPRMVPLANGGSEGAFAYCQRNLKSLPTLEAFFAVQRETFATERNYAMAATAAHFLLEGENRKYRASFFRLLDAAHRFRTTASTFDKCFPTLDRSKLQEEWLGFVRKIRLDP